MPRTDVPPPGQGKRSKRKAWHDNADQSIAIYSLSAEEMPEIKAIEESETLSQARVLWHRKKRPGVDFFLKAISAGLTNLPNQESHD